MERNKDAVRAAVTTMRRAGHEGNGLTGKDLLAISEGFGLHASKKTRKFLEGEEFFGMVTEDAIYARRKDLKKEAKALIASSETQSKVHRLREKLKKLDPNNTYLS